MANLQDTSVLYFSATEIQSTSGVPFIKPDNLSGGGYYVRQYETQTDKVNRTSNDVWSMGIGFDGLRDVQPDSLLMLYYFIPFRNDSSSWGGGYLEPMIFYKVGTNPPDRRSLGSSGYDCGVMNRASGNALSIFAYRNTILIDHKELFELVDYGVPFSASFVFYYKSYDGTLQWNQSRNQTLTSGTATLLDASVNDNYYAHIKIKELAKIPR